DLVMGNRFGGTIYKGAMPWLHQYIGNPFLTKLLNWLFRIKISDAHCGMRSFTRAAYERMALRTGGMEFASEMVVEAAKQKLRIAEVPINYYPRSAPSKLHSIRDGWRHIRFMMLYKPEPFLFFPGALVFLLGVLLSLTVLLRGNVGASHMHSLIFSSILVIIGFQTVATGIILKAYAAVQGIAKKQGWIKKLLDYHSLEMELALGIGLLLAGFALGLKVIGTWISTGFGALSEITTAMLAMVLAAVGIQTIFTAIFLSVLMLKEGET
ncbi:MAG: glycosyltransferase family 2 protein, partial [Candidatus Methanospirareceae archaeon]